MRLGSLLERAQIDHGAVAPSFRDFDRSDLLAIDIADVVSDSRRVGPGALMCCVRGAHTDGHDRLTDAIANGAVAALVDHIVDIGGRSCVQIVVDEPRSHVGRLVSVLIGEPTSSLRVVGVTGTNGKTSVTYMIDAMLRYAGRSVGRIGTIDTQYAGRRIAATHTTPDASELQHLFGAMLDAGVDDVVMEVSSHALDQQRVDGTGFAVVAFTNLQADHLDYHKTQAAYAAAKRRLFTAVFSKQCVINVADPVGSDIAAEARSNGLNVLTYGAVGADLEARSISTTASGTAFTLVGARVEAPLAVQSPYVGRFNVDNVLCALGVALTLGMALDEALVALTFAPQIPGRMTRIDSGRGFSVVVDYAHTADALRALLLTVRGLITDGRVITVFGCGGDRDRNKRPVMGSVAVEGSDLVVLTSDNPRSEDPLDIMNDVLVGIPTPRRPHIEPDRRRAIEHALRVARSGDVVVVAGKGHETGQYVGDEVLPFDDAVVVNETLAGLA